MATRIKIRNDTGSNWAARNPILAKGEIGLVIDGSLRRAKVGDGITPWNALEFAWEDGGGSGGATAHTHPASEISDATATGRSILTAANQAAARSSGLGSGATGDQLFTALTPAAARVVLEIDRTRVTQALDLSNATNVFVDTDLVFTLQGGVDYLIRGQFDLVATSGTGFRLQLLTSQNVNALATTANSLGWFALGGTVAPINSATLTTAEFANFTGSSTRRAQAEIRINLVATGTVRIRFAQNSGSAAPASVFKAGSFWTCELL